MAYNILSIANTHTGRLVKVQLGGGVTRSFTFYLGTSDEEIKAFLDEQFPEVPVCNRNDEESGKPSISITNSETTDEPETPPDTDPEKPKSKRGGRKAKV